ncbi:hypothetical protein M4D54_04360 [Brachybacterium sp. p3-SID1565]|uniref:hypothetical protein n=1 Tax=Brachybacterium sp. p3-SID1565 TaxID=2916046 RepID=UPI0021A4A160|nr:hypothetical protein [Brachybacterium sp. p3-SID1565]MCT1384866.1 hypothetical protein [Brachybacterium sp. p3-SID1565]
MNTIPHQDALRSRWTLEGTIPLSGVAENASWQRARSVATGERVALFVVHGTAALETADAARRAYLVEDPRLIPVRDVMVLDDPREDGADASGADPQPLTVVEYPLPAAPPLAALLRGRSLHPETARAIIGEAARGVETARRRGVRHQFLDSNRVFVDTTSGQVTILGVGVEAASHAGLDRSGAIASFQDTRALVALLYRALAGRNPHRSGAGPVPRPSQIAQHPVPADLDLLCDLVLNEAAEVIPETSRDLIAELEPWQSIPVTLEAYERNEESAPGRDGQAAPAPGKEAPDPAAPEQGDAVSDQGATAAEAAALAGSAGAGATAGAAGAVAGAGATARLGEHSAAEDPRPSVASTGAGGDGDPAASEDPATPTPHITAHSQQAQSLIRDLRLDQKRDDAAFPGHLDITLPRRPETAQASQDALGSDAARHSGAMRDSESGRSEDRTPGPAAADVDAPDRGAGRGATGVAAAGVAAAGAAAAGAAAGASSSSAGSSPLPARRSGTLWPLAPRREDGPAQPSSDPSQPLAEDWADGSRTPSQAALTPGVVGQPAEDAATPSSPEQTAAMAPVAPSEPTGPTGPIVVRGRDRSSLEGTDLDATVPIGRAALLRDVVNVAVDSDDPDAYTMGPLPAEQRSRISQWILLGGVLLVIVAMVLALSTITSGLRDRVTNPLNTDPPEASAGAPVSDGGGEEPAEEEPTEEEPPAPPATLRGVEVFTLGSDRAPDNADQTERITDGDPGTFWSTQIYTNPQYGNLKDGAGLRLDLGEPSTLTAVVATTARNSGGVIELRAVGEDGSLGDVLATGQFAGDGEARLAPPEPIEAQQVALWFPELPPDSNRDGFRGRIAELRVE